MKHNSLYDRQYGVIPKRSTNDAMTEFTADRLPIFDINNKFLYLFLDLSKAFDTIKHDNMLGGKNENNMAFVEEPWSGLVVSGYLLQRRQYGSHMCIKSETG